MYDPDLPIWPARRIFSRLRDQLPFQYHEKRLSAKETAVVMNRDISTVRSNAKSGILPSTPLYSLFDLENMFLDEKTRRYKGKDHTWWTKQEEELLERGVMPSDRSYRACITKRHRMRKNGHKMAKNISCP